jgi:hypothetical protein
MLFEFIVDFIIISLILYEYVFGKFQASGLIQCANIDANQAAPVIPE